MEDKEKNTCAKTGKVKLTKHGAEYLARTAVEIHHKYKCIECGFFHVSSIPHKFIKAK